MAKTCRKSETGSGAQRSDQHAGCALAPLPDSTRRNGLVAFRPAYGPNRYSANRTGRTGCQQAGRPATRCEVHPSAVSPSRNAMTRASTSGSSSAYGCRNATRRTPVACCARAASGDATAAPPSSVMNSRLLMCSPQTEDHSLPHRRKSRVCASQHFGPPDFRNGSIVCITAPQHCCPLHPS
jgi:hypothetical protein